MMRFVEFFKDVIDITVKHYPRLLLGLGYTMLIALIGTVIGLFIGLLLGIIRTIPRTQNKAFNALLKTADVIISAYVEIFRGTPMMVQAMVIYWGFAYLSGGTPLPLIPSGIFIVSINTGAYMTEIVRGGIISIDKGQFEGAYSVGMTHFQAMTRIIIPQVLKNILPSVANEFVINIKDTSVLNVIGVMELYYQSYAIRTDTYKIFQTFFITSILYLIMTFTVTRLLRLLEKKLIGAKDYVIFGSQSDVAAEIHIRSESDVG